MNVQILAVDDEEEIRTMVQRHFRFLGFGVDVACNGVDALSKMAQKRYELVITDIMMPEMNGVDLLREIRRQYPMTRVIMLSGYVTLDNALACMRLGAESLILKPLEDLGQVEEAVERSVASVGRWLNLLSQLQALKPTGHEG